MSFCTNCGNVLPKEAALKPGTCKNGHHFDDRSLKYCPLCSEPLGKWSGAATGGTDRTGGVKKPESKAPIVIAILLLAILALIIITQIDGSGNYPVSTAAPRITATPRVTSTPRRTGSQYDWLIGKWGRVCVNEGHARSGPGTGYSKAGIVYYDEWYEIREVKHGDTTKDWCKIRMSDGSYAWISTGLLEIDGKDGGTIYGNWAD